MDTLVASEVKANESRVAANSGGAAVPAAAIPKRNDDTSSTTTVTSAIKLPTRQKSEFETNPPSASPPATFGLMNINRIRLSPFQIREKPVFYDGVRTFSQTNDDASSDTPHLTEIIHSNPSPQPQNDISFEQLKASINALGILQPLLVRRLERATDDTTTDVADDQTLLFDFNYLLIAGHRRLRAAQELGLKVVPCMILRVTTTDHEADNSDDFRAANDTDSDSDTTNKNNDSRRSNSSISNLVFAQERERIVAQVAENRLRAATDPYDEAVALALTKTLADIGRARQLLLQVQLQDDVSQPSLLPDDSFLVNSATRTDLTNLQRLNLHQAYLGFLAKTLTAPAVAPKLPRYVVYLTAPAYPQSPTTSASGEKQQVLTAPAASTATYALTSQALAHWRDIEQECGFTKQSRIAALKLVTISPLIVHLLRGDGESGAAAGLSSNLAGLRSRLHAVAALPARCQEAVVRTILGGKGNQPQQQQQQQPNNSQNGAEDTHKEREDTEATVRFDLHLIRVIAACLHLPQMRGLWDTSTQADGGADAGGADQQRLTNPTTRVASAYSVTIPTWADTSALPPPQIDFVRLVAIARQEIITNSTSASRNVAAQARKVEVAYFADTLEGAGTRLLTVPGLNDLTVIPIVTPTPTGHNQPLTPDNTRGYFDYDFTKPPNANDTVGQSEPVFVVDPSFTGNLPPNGNETDGEEEEDEDHYHDCKTGEVVFRTDNLEAEGETELSEAAQVALLKLDEANRALVLAAYHQHPYLAPKIRRIVAQILKGMRVSEALDEALGYVDGKPVAANGIYTDSDSDSTASPYYYVNSSGDKVESQEEALVGGIQAFLAGVSQLEDAINLLRRATSNQHFTGMADNYQLYLSSQAEGLLEAFRGFGIPLAFRVQE